MRGSIDIDYQEIDLVLFDYGRVTVCVGIFAPIDRKVTGPKEDTISTSIGPPAIALVPFALSHSRPFKSVDSCVESVVLDKFGRRMK